MAVGTLGGLTSVYKHRLFSFSYAILTFVTFLIFSFLGSTFIILKSKQALGITDFSHEWNDSWVLLPGVAAVDGFQVDKNSFAGLWGYLAELCREIHVHDYILSLRESFQVSLVIRSILGGKAGSLLLSWYLFRLPDVLSDSSQEECRPINWPQADWVDKIPGKQGKL